MHRFKILFLAFFLGLSTGSYAEESLHQKLKILKELIIGKNNENLRQIIVATSEVQNVWDAEDQKIEKEIIAKIVSVAAEQRHVRFLTSRLVDSVLHIGVSTLHFRILQALSTLDEFYEYDYLNLDRQLEDHSLSLACIATYLLLQKDPLNLKAAVGIMYSNILKDKQELLPAAWDLIQIASKEIGPHDELYNGLTEYLDFLFHKWQTAASSDIYQQGNILLSIKIALINLQIPGEATSTRRKVQKIYNYTKHQKIPKGNEGRPLIDGKGIGNFSCTSTHIWSSH